MLGLLASMLPGLFKIGDKLIEDKDKKMEYAFKVQEMYFKQMEILINMKTYPWLDGLIKLAYASETIIKGLFRPVASAALFAYGLFNPDVLQNLHDNYGAMGDAIIATIFGALPSWGVSRHVEKKRKDVIANKQDNDDFWGD
jgi:hypothetical protein